MEVSSYTPSQINRNFCSDRLVRIVIPVSTLSILSLPPPVVRSRQSAGHMFYHDGSPTGARDPPSHLLSAEPHCPYKVIEPKNVERAKVLQLSHFYSRTWSGQSWLGVGGGQ